MYVKICVLDFETQFQHFFLMQSRQQRIQWENLFLINSQKLSFLIKLSVPSRIEITMFEPYLNRAYVYIVIRIPLSQLKNRG